MIGTRIGSWRIESEIGHGPLGVVYRGKGTDDRSAAVKLLSPEAIRDPDALAKFAGDMLGLRRLAHPNLAGFYDAGVHAGQAFYAREWVEGVDLATFLKTHYSPDSWRTLAIPLTVQIARALNHGHRRSLLHRRLTASNIIVMPDGRVKITDFGMTKIVPLPPLSLAGDSLAGLAYLAPELFTGKPYTKRSDFYSLGAVIYAATTGRPPFTAGSSSEYMHKHCYLLPDRPASFVSKLPNDFDDLICNLLQKDPARRPASAPAIVDELDRIRGKVERKGEAIPWPADPGDTNLHTALSDTAIKALKGEDADERPRPFLSRMAVVVPLFLIVVGLIVWLLFKPGPSAEDYYAGAKKLLATGKADDADVAWDDYLEPLQRKYPDRFATEIAKLRELRSAKRELNRAIDQAAKAKYASETDKQYARAIALLRVGEYAEAKQLLERILQSTPGDDLTHDLAKQALEAIEKSVK